MSYFTITRCPAFTYLLHSNRLVPISTNERVDSLVHELLSTHAFITDITELVKTVLERFFECFVPLLYMLCNKCNKLALVNS